MIIVRVSVEGAHVKSPELTYGHAFMHPLLRPQMQARSAKIGRNAFE